MSDKKSLLPDLGRRDVLRGAGLGVLALAGGGLTTKEALATPESAAKALSSLTGGGNITDGKVEVKLPEIAENGRTVPITVTVDSPMSEGDYVKSIHIVSEGNPSPEVASFNLSPMAGKAEVSTRMRLGKTQNIRAAAVMSDGKVYGGVKEVKVTIGGCGG